MQKRMRGKNARETLPFKIDGEKRPSHLGGKRAEPEIDTTANSGERLLTTLIMSSQIRWISGWGNSVDGRRVYLRSTYT
jgi:hypothetical protein